MKERRVSEASIQTAVLEHWRSLGLPNTLVAAIPNARAFGQPGLTRGLFDLLCIGPDISVGFIELKASDGVLRPDQESFRKILIVCGVHCAVTYGRDEPIRVLEEWRLVRPSSLSTAAARSGCAGKGEAAGSASLDPSISSPRGTGAPA